MDWERGGVGCQLLLILLNWIKACVLDANEESPTHVNWMAYKAFDSLATSLGPRKIH